MFSGSIVALLTPMTARGQIDTLSLSKLIHYHIDSGTAAITVMGTTGEAATLTEAEYWQVVERVVAEVEGKMPIIVGIGTNSTAKAIARAQKAAALAVAACLVVTPYYNKPSQEGLYQHYKTVAENSPIDHILYNVPSRTGCDLMPETVARLATLPRIIGIKEATGDLRRVSVLRRLTPAHFCLLSGDDATFLDFMLLGGDGTISVTANVAAKQMAQICSLARQDSSAARQQHESLIDLHQALFLETNPAPVKWAAARLALINSAHLRLPLVKLSEFMQPQLENALKTAKLL